MAALLAKLSWGLTGKKNRQEAGVVLSIRRKVNIFSSLLYLSLALKNRNVFHIHLGDIYLTLKRLSDKALHATCNKIAVTIFIVYLF